MQQQLLAKIMSVHEFAKLGNYHFGDSRLPNCLKCINDELCGIGITRQGARSCRSQTDALTADVQLTRKEIGSVYGPSDDLSGEPEPVGSVESGRSIVAPVFLMWAAMIAWGVGLRTPICGLVLGTS